MRVKTNTKVEHFTEGDPLNTEDVVQVDDINTKRTFIASCSNVFKNATVEPLTAMFILAWILAIVTTQNLSLEKACRVNLNFTDEICRSLKLQELESQNEYEKETQKLIANFMSYKTYISATVPCIICIFVGSYSDKTGRRKVFLIIPTIGQMLLCISNILNVYFFYELNLEVLTFSEAIFEGFSGSWSLPLFITFAYISSITTERNRTFRLGLLSFAFTVGFPIGMGMSGVLLKKTGYYGCYGAAMAFHFINLIYTVVMLKEPPKTPEQKKVIKKSFFKTMFSLTSARESFSVMFKQGPNNRRLRMIVYVLVIAILFGPMYGEISILYLSTRYRFNWNEVQFSIFQTYNFILHTAGTIFSITVFSKILGWHDSILGVISTISKIAASFVYCFAPSGKIFAIAPIVEILNGTAILAMRSTMSKLVDPSEFGKVGSIVSITENLMPLLYVPLYTTVYKATMDVLPGAVFLMGAANTVLALGVFSWLLYEHRKGVRRIVKEEVKETDDVLTKEHLMHPN